MTDNKDEKPAEFEAFRDLTRKLLDVTKEDLDRARAGDTDPPQKDAPTRGY